MTSDSPRALAGAMRAGGYVVDDALATALHLARALERPLLIEGEAGVGKTEVARSVSAALGAPMIRLQCYEGLDAQHALYDWDYRRQLLAIQLARESGAGGDVGDAAAATDALYDRRFLVHRPLLQAISGDEQVVLLIDEIDRADEAFEALLLEVLSDYQISIPELGTVAAVSRPLVILTSNGVRELSDALRRRCLYHYLDYPDAAKEREIVTARLPRANIVLVAQAVDAVQRLRARGMRKTPGVAETLDWTASLLQLGIGALTDDPQAVEASLSALIKTRDDLQVLQSDPDAMAVLTGAVATPSPAHGTTSASAGSPS